MKRDMDLVRKILLEVEEKAAFQGGIEINIEGYSEEQVTYHIMILTDARLLEVMNMSSLGEILLLPKRLTWEGHEFLDAARDNARWEKAKGAMAQAGGFALDVMKQLLVELLKAELKLP